jgi:uncharacterized OB-fold protein
MTKLLNGQCGVCGGQIEFPAEAAGTTAECPHCGKPTELFLAVPPQARMVPAKTVVYAAIAILILISGLVAAIIALKRAERMTGRNSATPITAPRPPAVPTPPANK